MFYIKKITMAVQHHHNMLDTINNIGQVGTATGTAIWLEVNHFNELLTTISLIGAIAFTIYKFISVYKRNQKYK